MLVAVGKRVLSSPISYILMKYVCKTMIIMIIVAYLKNLALVHMQP